MNEQPSRNLLRGARAEFSSSLATTVMSWMRSFRRGYNGDSPARATLDELIEERDEAEVPINDDERILLANILELRGRTVHDVMVPRADIIAVDCNEELSQVIDMITHEGHSRLPIYRETLDDTIGVIHAKDVLAWRGNAGDFTLEKARRRILFVSPSMQVLELLLEMRVKRSHMALVVDEFGGVDGLVTIEDLVEEIVGEIEDEHDQGAVPDLFSTADGGLIADARVTIEALEREIGAVVSEKEREDFDTLGGLVFALAGRVPIRGELVKHLSGLEFEILEADPRRIKRLRLVGPVPVIQDESDGG